MWSLLCVARGFVVYIRAAEFRFTGDPLLEFEVFETDTNGYPLESKGGTVYSQKPNDVIWNIHIQLIN